MAVYRRTFTAIGERIGLFIPLALRHRDEAATSIGRLTRYPQAMVDPAALPSTRPRGRRRRPGTPRMRSARSRRRASARPTGWAATWPSVGLAPDAMITSPKVRAARTAEIVAIHLGVAVSTDPRLARPLRPRGSRGDPGRCRLAAEADRRRARPGLQRLVAALVGAPSIPMKKGALARIDVDGPLVPGGGTLRWLLPPDLLPGG